MEVFKRTKVFKWLLLTIFLTTVPFIVIEYINIAISAPLLKNNIRLALNSSCRYFTAETYGDVSRGSEDRYNLPDLRNSSNGALVSGRFYNLSDKDQIYNYIISGFKSTILNERFTYMHSIYSSIGDKAALEIPMIANFNSSSKYYTMNKVTPGNLGIPFIDIDIVSKMFRYNVANLLIDGNTQNLVVRNGRTHARFNGFEVLTEGAYIDVNYFITKTNTPYFSTVTGLNPGNMGISDSDYIMVAEVDYTVPVAYRGITPMKKAMEWLWDRDTRVNGTVENKDHSGYVERQLNLDVYENMESNTSQKYLLNRIYYTLIK